MPANRLLALLIVAATISFAVGVSIERSQESGAETGAEASHAEGTAGEVSHSDSSEELLGIDPEAVGLVIVAVVVSLILAAAVWIRPELRGLFPLVALAMLAFAALDVR